MPQIDHEINADGTATYVLTPCNTKQMAGMKRAIRIEYSAKDLHSKNEALKVLDVLKGITNQHENLKDVILVIKNVTNTISAKVVHPKPNSAIPEINLNMTFDAEQIEGDLNLFATHASKFSKALNYFLQRHQIPAELITSQVTANIQFKGLSQSHDSPYYNYNLSSFIIPHDINYNEIEYEDSLVFETEMFYGLMITNKFDDSEKELHEIQQLSTRIIEDMQSMVKANKRIQKSSITRTDQEESISQETDTFSKALKAFKLSETEKKSYKILFETKLYCKHLTYYQKKNTRGILKK